MTPGRVRATVDALLLLMIAAAAVKVGPMVLGARGSAEGGAELAIGARPEHVRVSLDRRSDGVGEILADVGAGECRYVVVGAESCPYCYALSQRWTVTALNETGPSGVAMPYGWSTFWVLAVDVDGQDFLDPAFPVPVYYTKDVDALVELGVGGVPFHLVLDSTGAVISGGIGGDLLPRSSFGGGCTVSDEPDIAPDELSPIGKR